MVRLITRAVRHRVEVSAPFFLAFFLFVSHLICKISAHALCIISLSPHHDHDGDTTDAEKLVDVDICFENLKGFVYLRRNVFRKAL